MHILIIYDSLYGNTEKIAKGIAKELKSLHSVTIVTPQQAQISDFSHVNILFVGSPTHGGRPKENLLTFLHQITNNSLEAIHVVAFDTRFDETKQNPFLKLLLKKIGYAAPKILDILEHKGGIPIAPPKGFIVNKKHGPLQNGELERAVLWSKTVVKKLI